MSHAGVPLVIALLGPGDHALAQALEHALARLRTDPGACSALPSPVWRMCQSAESSRDAALRWLLAWEEDPQHTPEQSISALQAHQAQRQSLHALGLPYQVLRGKLEERVIQALQSLARHWPDLAQRLPQTGIASRRPGVWACDSCSDPDCEHRSFTALLAQRDASVQA